MSTSSTQRTDRHAPGRSKPIGTGVPGNIKVVQTKLVSVFATKFAPDLDAEALSGYLKQRLDRDVSCERIDTASNRFSSFKVCAE